MNSESTLKSAIGFFIIIVLGAMVSAIIGGVFAAIIATISPEFAAGLLSDAAEQHLTSYSFAVGMLWGLLLGGAASGFACFLATVIKILRVRFEYKKTPGTDS